MLLFKRLKNVISTLPRVYSDLGKKKSENTDKDILGENEFFFNFPPFSKQVFLAL